ncbi:MAG: hypothetical protein KGZ79_05135 [Dethiobacter sp.]|jgi:hypothetical protein|nr:hypothetical protein [Dethiobacter sp.]
MKKVVPAILILLFMLCASPVLAAVSDISATVDTPSSLDVTVGEKFAIAVTVRSDADPAEADDVVISGVVGSSGLTIEPKTISIVGGETRKIYLYGTANVQGVYDFRIKLSESGSPDGVIQGDELLIRATNAPSLPPPLPPPQPSPLLTVTGVAFNPPAPNLNNAFTINVSFRNDNYTLARNVIVSLEGGKNFEVMDLTNRVSFANVWGGSTYVASYTIRAKPDRESNRVDVNFTYQYDNGQGVYTETLNLPLGDVPGQTPQVPTSPFLKLGTFSVEPEGESGDFLLRFQLKNLGEGRAKSVMLRFTGDQVFTRETSNAIFIQQLAAKETTEVVVKMRVAAKGSTAYTIPVTLGYSSDDGEVYSGQESLTVLATAIGLKDAAPEPAAGTPRVMLSKYTLSQSQVLAGNTIKLVLSIENSSRVEVRNIKISLGVIQVGGETGGTVFSPVNSSNSFYVDSISAKKTHVREIELYVDPNAAAKTYIVPVEIEYEDLSGRAYRVDEMVNIPVIQESRLQVLAVEVPPMAMVGQPLPITAEFVNVGKVALKNFLISIEGDFAKENATYFLASLEMGMSDYFMGMVFPQQEGLLAGNVVFTYTDNTNKEVRIEKPFELHVQAGGFEKPPVDYYPPDYPPYGGKPPLMAGLKAQLKWLAPVLLVLAFAAFVAVKKRRAKRGEMFNEDF